MKREFFCRDTRKTAKDLLGCRIVRGGLEAEIVETEAYLGSEDPASHAFNGKTERNAPMYEKPGRAYIYVSYGIHDMFNVVAHEDDEAGAVLVRAAKPVRGLVEMKSRRSTAERVGLCNGPGKLAEALGIDTGDNRKDLFGEDFRIEGCREIDSFDSGPRIGVSRGKDLEYRYTVEDSDFLSR